MKSKILIALALFVFLLQSCQRSFTPYEAANRPRGKKCGVIR